MANIVAVDTTLVGAIEKQHVSWLHSSLRIKNPEASIPFYENYFDMTLIDKRDERKGSTSYYLATLRDEDKDSLATPGSDEAKTFVHSFKGTALKLTHEHGVENDKSLTYNNGNVEPNRGFGHIAFFSDDVYAACDVLDKAGVGFKKKPDEGRMKGLAFALDPDGYWIEIIKRKTGDDVPGRGRYSLSQTMIRVKNIEASLKFYRDLFGFKLVAHKEFPEAEFSLHFLLPSSSRDLNSAPADEDSWEYMKGLFDPILELTFNYGTDKTDFRYHNGNTDPVGFGEIGLLVDNIATTRSLLEGAGAKFQDTEDGHVYTQDPDGYHVVFVERSA
eukprot:TRINITY_DN8690_c0_g1_i1.p1 TRINITY_DN8690_c0_g1~~TRINITY_DN8690_c0_g1_i1.p1  ORF type:complete len:340 (+),score=69.22 TRINITY_DN8690_c0_g1_i1:30-1022(+)